MNGGFGESIIILGSGIYSGIVYHGCVTAGSINQQYAKIKFEDGINKKEALYIAQKHCLDDEFCSKNWDISSARPYEDEARYSGKWAVSFTYKSWSISPSPCVIAVNKITGKVDNFDILY